MEKLCHRRRYYRNAGRFPTLPSSCSPSCNWLVAKTKNKEEEEDEDEDEEEDEEEEDEDEGAERGREEQEAAEPRKT